MQRLKKCWSVVSAKFFDVLSPASHSMLGIHFSSTHRPFPRWEIDFSCAPAPHTMLSTRSMRVMMIYKKILDAEHFNIRSLIDDKEEKLCIFCDRWSASMQTCVAIDDMSSTHLPIVVLLSENRHFLNIVWGPGDREIAPHRNDRMKTIIDMAKKWFIASWINII